MRPAPPAIESAGNDSFLDVITNIVGIMIILVMIVSDRAKRAPVAPENVPRSAELEQLQAVAATKASLIGDNDRLVGQMRQLQLEALVRYRERARLATMIRAAELETNKRRQDMNEQQRRQFDLQRELSLAQSELTKLETQRGEVQSQPKRTTVIENYPTPLSKPVDGKELHIQLRGGRVTIIPIDELIEKFQTSARQKVSKLRDRTEFTETIGPIGGFRMRYTLERQDIPPETVAQTGRGGALVQLAKYELVPTSSQLGEPIEQALAKQSIFLAQLEGYKPEKYTVTLWTYDDSFDAFRALRKELYHRGYAVAARPLPKDTPIGGSPKGTKSAAQ
jgi:hypothetical protein